MGFPAFPHPFPHPMTPTQKGTPDATSVCPNELPLLGSNQDSPDPECEERRGAPAHSGTEHSREHQAPELQDAFAHTLFDTPFLLGGVRVAIDPSMPRDEIRFVHDGLIVGKFKL